MKKGKYPIELTDLNKILFPKSKISKKDCIKYYEYIAPIMIEHLKDRPLTMYRFPNGITDDGFYQKEIPDYFPKWIDRVSIKKKDKGYTTYVVCNTATTLIYLANQGCFTPHIWLSKTDKLTFPDRMMFDLDPAQGISFEKIQWAAKELKKVLESIQLTSFVMTTGSRGAHIVVPLKRIHSFDYVRAIAQNIARIVAKKYSQDLTLEIRKTNRGKRIFIDTLRNAFGQTGVCPYAIRPKEGAPIATPLEWNEFLHKRMQSTYFTLSNIRKRMSKKEDPWSQMGTYAHSLRHCSKRLQEL
jgi:bifunctional non-homologous end joining protein LigD